MRLDEEATAMWVKICANTNLADALLAVEAGADAVGFVFAPSKRRMNSEQMSAITSQLPVEVEKVGVFATDNLDDSSELEHQIASPGLTVAQLHGTFNPDLVHQLSEKFGGGLKIIQTVAYAVDEARDAEFIATLQAAFAEPAIWAVLVDAAKSGVSGGLGVAFDWKHVGRLVRQAMPDGDTPRVILAGGLRPETVANAIAEFEPWGVDVASGTEASPGKKDAARVRNFIDAARQS
jgi:phosphoribosylanthranilate isomerase